MSLKIEQRLNNHQITEYEPRIFATGVFLVPMKITLAGKEQYVWVADEFVDDSFLNGGLHNPKSLANLYKNCSKFVSCLPKNT